VTMVTPAGKWRRAFLKSLDEIKANLLGRWMLTALTA
jgi:hypothetical protein